MRWTALLVVAMMGCSSTHIELLPSAPSLPPICTDGVRVFLDSTQVGKPYTLVARLNFHSSFGVITDETRIVDQQRGEAAKLGANGLILDTGNFKGTIGTVGKALAVYIPGDSLRTARTCKGH